MATVFATALAGMGTATAIGAAGATAAGAGSWLTLASAGSTILGGLAAMKSSRMEADALEADAAQDDVSALQETLRGKQDALEALRGLNRDAARIAVSGFASGIGSEGTIAVAQEEAARTGYENIRMASDNAGLASSRYRESGRQKRFSAKGTRKAGLFSAISGGLRFASSQMARG